VKRIECTQTLPIRKEEEFEYMIHVEDNDPVDPWVLNR
jgi:hypothetical protein